MRTRRSSATAFGQAPGWGWRGCAAATLGAAPATIPRPIGPPCTPHGRDLGAMDAGARACEPCLGRFPPLWTGAVPDTAQEISPMAEPRRAAATAPRFESGRFLIVEARYYDAIGADLLAGARRA